jgi:hypothetical protein
MSKMLGQNLLTSSSSTPRRWPPNGLVGPLTSDILSQAANFRDIAISQWLLRPGYTTE